MRLEPRPFKLTRIEGLKRRRIRADEIIDAEPVQHTTKLNPPKRGKGSRIALFGARCLVLSLIDIDLDWGIINCWLHTWQLILGFINLDRNQLCRLNSSYSNR